MMISTQDPVTLADVANPELAPCIIESQGSNLLKICFESEETLNVYLSMPHQGYLCVPEWKKIYHDIMDIPANDT